jgi:hypothetical protein
MGTLTWTLGGGGGGGGFTPSRSDRYGKEPLLLTEYEVTGWLRVVAKCSIVLVAVGSCPAV